MREHSSTCVPPLNLVLKPFQLCPFDKVKVVLFCTEPPEETSAFVGDPLFPFGTPEMFEAYRKEYPEDVTNPVDLSCWARQGVLLLNYTQALLSEEEMLDSYDLLTDLCKAFHVRKEALAWVSFGSLSFSARGEFSFLGSLNKFHVQETPKAAPFQNVNLYLASKGLTPIDWRV